jgi:Uma2 family endonuclease
MDLIVFVFCEVCNLNVECLGQTTWRKKALSKGLEPDACYYIKSAELIHGKRIITLDSDPPPDIAVEIDLTRRSFRKLSIYAALGIPEVWRYDGQTLRIYALTENQYSEIHESQFLSGLTDSMLARVLEASTTGETMDILKAFRKRLQELGR